jgi:aminoglycoside phosphotransferase (APT) family kinase protein
MLRGLAAEPVSAWLAQHVPGARAPFAFELITAGGSNLTYRATDAHGRAWALRRGPTSHRLPTAHDMEREWRILEALHRQGAVPVPEPVALCRDASVTGAPFYVMAFVEGRILRSVASARDLDAAQCRAATQSLVDVQIALHGLDPDAIGLGDLGRRGDYVARQLRRWRTQYERTNVRRLPLLEELHERLARAIPPETLPPALAHGDYRFDNTVLGPDLRVRAVLDWELCTIGDPVADFGWSLMYWGDPGDPMYFIDDVPTLHPEFPRRTEVAQLYQRRGYPLEHLSYFVVFGWWKMACIVEGAHGRLLGGAGGGMAGRGPGDVAKRVERLLEQATQAARGVV